MARMIRANSLGLGKMSEAPTFMEAQAFVGGLVETITLHGSGMLLVNEEGRSMDLPINHSASHLAKRIIVGAAILLETEDEITRTLGEGS